MGTDHHPQEFLPALAFTLLRVNPFLMGQVVRLWASQEGLPNWGAQQVRALLQTLIYDMAGAQRSQDMARKQASLLASVSDKMGVDSAFIERGLIGRALSWFQGQRLRPLDEENLAAAMYLEPFRRLLGVRLLEAINSFQTMERERREGV